MHKFKKSFYFIFYFISIFLDWRLGFEPSLQLKGQNLRALQNETHMRASILTIEHTTLYNIGVKLVIHFPSIVSQTWNLSSNSFMNPYLIHYQAYVELWSLNCLENDAEMICSFSPSLSPFQLCSLRPLAGFMSLG